MSVEFYRGGLPENLTQGLLIGKLLIGGLGVIVVIIAYLLDLCVSSLRRGHANLHFIVPILTDDPRRESVLMI